jgi:hypothetical protein
MKINITGKMFPKSDSDIMFKLWKTIINDSHTDEIHRLYIKYISATAPRPIQNCNCLISVSQYYDTLRNWHMKNTDKFEK